MSRSNAQHSISSQTPNICLSRSSTMTLTGVNAHPTQHSFRSDKAYLTEGLAHSHDVWIEIEPGKHVIHKVHTVDTNSELREGHVPQAWFIHAQRTLLTLTLVGTLMAIVNSQVLSLTPTSPPSFERTMATIFACVALFLTALSALYCAVTYVWLRPDWVPKAHKFDEWVSSSTTAMITWAATGLAIGSYCGFLAVVCFLFAAIDHTIAMICTCVFVIFSISPLIWGIYRWQRLYSHSLMWKPESEGPVAVSAHKLDRSTYV